jgi:hypothetical protein
MATLTDEQTIDIDRTARGCCIRRIQRADQRINAARKILEHGYFFRETRAELRLGEAAIALLLADIDNTEYHCPGLESRVEIGDKISAKIKEIKSLRDKYNLYVHTPLF